MNGDSRPAAYSSRMICRAGLLFSRVHGSGSTVQGSRPMARFLQRSFIIAVFCVGLPDFAAAQSGASSGQIVGQVVDPSGAAVPAAHVDVRNKETSYARDVSTDTAGRYAVSQVPLGAYQVLTTADGFRAESREVTVTLGSTITANFRLAVGARAEVVEVS